MKKCFCSLSIALAFALFSGCSTTGNSGKVVKLNDKEYTQLEAIVKNAVLNMPDSKLSRTEKQYVENNKPIFRVYYFGCKKGRYSFSWELRSGKVILVKGNGDMIDFKSSLKNISVFSLKADKPQQI